MAIRLPQIAWRLRISVVNDSNYSVFSFSSLNMTKLVWFPITVHSRSPHVYNNEQDMQRFADPLQPTIIAEIAPE